MTDAGVGSRRVGITPVVVTALRCNAGLRLLSGFMTIFMAFLLDAHPFQGWEDKQDPAARLGDRVGRGREHGRHRDRRDARRTETPGGHGLGLPGRRRGRRDLCRLVLRPDPGDDPRRWSRAPASRWASSRSTR